jgi:hypothetical protein
MIEGLLEHRHIKRRQVRICDEHVGRGWEVGQKVFDNKLSPDVEIDNNVLFAQNCDPRGIMCSC